MPRRVCDAIEAAERVVELMQDDADPAEGADEEGEHEAQLQPVEKEESLVVGLDEEGDEDGRALPTRAEARPRNDGSRAGKEKRGEEEGGARILRV